MKPRFNPLLRALAAAIILPQAAYSATLYWDGSSTDWGTATAWSESATATTPNPAAAPGTGDTAVFSASTVTATADVQLAGNQAAQGISLSSAAVGATIKSSTTTSRTLSIGGGGVTIADGTGNLTVGVGGTSAGPIAVELAAPQTWNVGSGRTMTVTNSISGSSLLTKTGPGTLSLNGASTHTGGLTLSAGTLLLSNAGALGSATGTFTIGGGTIQNPSTTTSVLINVNKPISITNSFTYTVPTDGNGGLNLGAGGVTLGAANITVTSAGGFLVMGGGTSDGGNGYGITKTGGGTLALLGTNTYTGETNLTNSGNLRVSGPEGIANTPVHLNGGALEIGGAITNLNLGTAPGQIRWSAGVNGGLSADTGYRSLSLNGNAPLSWGVTPNFISGGGIFILSTAQSSGTIDLTNNIDLGGADRRFSIRDGSAPGMPDAVLSGIITNGRISLQGGGTLSVTNAATDLTGIMPVTSASVLRVPSMAYLANASIVVSGASSLEVGSDAVIPLGTGSGQLSFSGANAGGISSSGTARSITLVDPATSGTDLVWGAAPFSVSGNFYLSGGSSDTTTNLTNNIDFGSTTRTIVVRNGAAPIDAALSGVLTGTGGLMLINSGAGMLLANPANSYSGATTLSGGTLNVTELANGGQNSSVGSSSADAANLILGGNLRYVGDGSSTDRLFSFSASPIFFHNGTGPLDFTSTGSYVPTGTATRTITASGISPFPAGLRGVIPDVSGTAAVNLVKTGQTPWVLGGTNTFTGLISVNNGSLTLDYSQGGVPLFPGQTGTANGVTLENGHLIIKGAAGGSSVPLTNLRLANGNFGVHSILTLDAMAARVSPPPSPASTSTRLSAPPRTPTCSTSPAARRTSSP